MQLKNIFCLFIVILVSVSFSGCLDNSKSTNGVPTITFKQNLISGRMVVTSVDRNVSWTDIDVWVDGELHNYNYDDVKVNDTVYTGVLAKLVNIVWKPTNELIGTWNFYDKYSHSEIEVVNYTVATSWFNEIEKQYVYMPGFYHGYPDNATDLCHIINTTVENVGDALVNWILYTYKFYNASDEYLSYEIRQENTYLSPWNPLEYYNFSHSFFKSFLDLYKDFENTEKVVIEIEAIYIDYWATE